MAKLHQILAVEAGVRTQTQKDLTKAHHGLQRVEPLSGVSRTYESAEDGGEELPPESTRLQVRAPEVLKETAKILEKQYNIVATRDFGNVHAKADVVVDGKVLIKDAPTPFLLWLEKRLEDLHTFICKLPLLPPDVEWEWDEKHMCFKNANEMRTHRTKKIEDHKVVVPASTAHPAQIVKVTTDKIVGYWNTLKYSGCLERGDVQGMKDRVELLLKAVKYAREQANSVEVTDQKFGGDVLKFVFGRFA